MPAVTYLSDREGLKVETCPDLDELLQEVRATTGRDWRVLTVAAPDLKHGFLWLRRTRQWRYSVLIGVHGEFQIINFWRPWSGEWSINHYVPAELAMAYFYGTFAAPTPEQRG